MATDTVARDGLRLSGGTAADLVGGPSPRPTRRRRKEGGFALLLIFLMAAILAISLYLEIPRVAVESERAKEQLLVERGEQYKRAIQLFVKKAGRYPGDIKELESFQNQRFLRHRYIDPMTGKDEWRLIHVANGVLTDSKINKPQKQGEEKKDNGTFAGVENSFGSGTNANQQGGAAVARERRRTSDGGAGMGPELPAQPGGAGVAGAPGTNPPQLIPGQQNLTGQVQPGMPNQVQPIPGMAIPGQPGGLPGQIATGQPMQGVPGQMVPGQVMPGQPGFTGGRATFPGQQAPGVTGSNGSPSSGGGSSFGAVSNSFGGGNSFGSPNSTSTGNGMPLQSGQAAFNGQQLPGQPGAPVNSQFGGVSPYQTNPSMVGGAPGIQQQGMTAAPPNSQAADMINRILTSPRPGGMPNTGQVGGGAVMGGGIAGVASNAEGEGIMIYNDHTLYSEWEFIYDPQKQKQIPNPNATGAGGTPAQQLGSTPGAGAGVGNANGFGATGGFGTSSGTGATGGSTGGSSFGSSNSFGGGNSFGTGTPTGGRGVSQPQSPPPIPGRQ